MEDLRKTYYKWRDRFIGPDTWLRRVWRHFGGRDPRTRDEYNILTRRLRDVLMSSDPWKAEEYRAACDATKALWDYAKQEGVELPPWEDPPDPQ